MRVSRLSVVIAEVGMTVETVDVGGWWDAHK
jgi:hypothetical protein